MTISTDIRYAGALYHITSRVSGIIEMAKDHVSFVDSFVVPVRGRAVLAVSIRCQRS